MPELPDLQVFRKNLEDKFKNKKVTDIEVINPRKIDVPETKLKETLIGKKLISIVRNGKELFFYFDKNNILAFHLMLKGEFHLYSETEPVKHMLFGIRFSNNDGIILTDWRKAAHARLNPELPDVPDALSDDVNYKYLALGFQKHKGRKIKEILTDQKFIRGIGNAYADEILWDARINPLSRAGAIPGDKVKLLAKSIKKVLKKSEKEIIKIAPKSIKGEQRGFMKIHNSHSKQSSTGAEVKKIEMGGRSTYYTDEQVYYT